jgi:hypothetical protein
LPPPDDKKLEDELDGIDSDHFSDEEPRRKVNSHIFPLITSEKTQEKERENFYLLNK